jgi:uncharacterized membrane protein YebE (DUF533 family)
MRRTIGNKNVFKKFATDGQKYEVYLAACLAIDLDTPSEHSYLNKLTTVLRLSLDLTEQIRSQAKQALYSERVLN